MKALADYKHQYYLPAEKDGYSGVALLSKIEPIKVDLGFGTDEAKEHDAEGCRQTLAIKLYITVRFKPAIIFQTSSLSVLSIVC